MQYCLSTFSICRTYIYLHTTFTIALLFAMLWFCWWLWFFNACRVWGIIFRLEVLSIGRASLRIRRAMELRDLLQYLGAGEGRWIRPQMGLACGDLGRLLSEHQGATLPSRHHEVLSISSSLDTSVNQRAQELFWNYFRWHSSLWIFVCDWAS